MMSCCGEMVGRGSGEVLVGWWRRWTWERRKILFDDKVAGL